MAAVGIDTKRRALGKGLESLLPAIQPPAAQASVPQSAAETEARFGRPLEIALDQIDRNPQQTRLRMNDEKFQELVRSVKATGVVQPIVVRALPSGRYQLIMGERRWRASFDAGKATVPAIVREVSDEQAMEMTIVENLQREDLNPMDQAHAYQRLSTQYGMTHDQMALRTGKDRASVTNFLRLLKLPPPVQEMILKDQITFGHGRALLALEEPERMLAAAQKVVAEGMSVRQTESYVQALLMPKMRMTGESGPNKRAKPIDPNVREAEERLRRRLGLKVAIEDKRGRGRVIIEYAGLEDFDAILTALGGEG